MTARIPRGRAVRPVQTAPRRRGAVLLTVLWLLTAGGLLAVLGLTTAREAVATAEHRIGFLRSRWATEGCVARARSAVDAALRADRGRAADAAWSSLDTRLAASPLLRGQHGCQVILRPAGHGADLNTLDPAAVGRLLRWLGVVGASADSMAAALIDWRDADDETTPGGAERDWYRSAGRVPPRNGPLADTRELYLVRGFDALPAMLDSALMDVVEVGGARVSLAHAAPAALASLPGFTAEAVARVLALRQAEASQALMAGSQRQALTLVAIGDGLSGDARSTLAANATHIARLITTTPDAWQLHATVLDGATVPAARDPEHGSGVAIVALLVRAGEGVAVTQVWLTR